MLSPDTRRVLLEALRPPEGFRFDRAIATTYTLDLTALLIAPLSFSMFDEAAVRASRTGSSADVEHVDPFALLKAARSYAERTSVFCQSGRIAFPAKYHRLHAYLEESVVEVAPPSASGVFHPKLWIVRMLGVDDAVAYRLLCLTRNLTFDQSWDTALVLDGSLQDRSRAIAANHPLADFVAALPTMALRTPHKRILTDIDLVSDELRKVRFDLPDDFDEVAFHPIGIPNYQGNPIPETDRALIVSPFVTSDGLKDIAAGGVLVSRADELEALAPEALEPFDVYVLHDGAEVLELSQDSDLGNDANEYRPPPQGLHAKLYVQDDGWNAHVWTGSANATSAAFHHNVEFLIELVGKKSLVGVEATLNGRKDELGLQPLLSSWSPPQEAPPSDPTSALLDERLNAARREVSRIRWEVLVRPGTKEFGLILRGDGRIELPAAIEWVVWPISVPDTFARTPTRDGHAWTADFGTRSFEALTTFFAVRLRATEGDESAEEVFVVNAELKNAPADRTARILQSLLDDPQKVLQFLRMLLATDPLEALDALRIGATDAENSTAPNQRRREPPLLEAMMRALDREPARLDSIELVVRDLLSTEDGRRLLPPDFLKVWEPIRDARKALGKESAA